mgnify:CR=1 FL=1
MKYHYAAFTHAGSHYKENQDAILVAGRVYQSPNAFLTGTVDTTQLAGGQPHPAGGSAVDPLNELDSFLLTPSF